ncbi:hypothetical protein LBMAG56_18000 [Verrucomicrobiota bacterium]|nr:hypothetical protein LBMAG56_18000 [Verrucomicrobiota bacterium]
MSRRWVAGVLALLTLVIYWPTAGHDFVDYDDSDYVYGNQMVLRGLTWEGIVWAFTTTRVANWHPLTWLSHMLDCSLFGSAPAGPHIVNVLLHVANAVLVLLLLHRMTGGLWRSAAVAALFAWHPVHVESVAWISERKDLLSTLFGLASLIAYHRYATGEGRRWYELSLGAFALSLLAKPMLVTLPCVMLLLDYWPLGRLFPQWNAGASGRSPTAPGGARVDRPAVIGLLVEKIPFLVATVALSIVTLIAQRGAMMSVVKLSLTERIINAGVAYAAYLGKTFWPVNLACPYVDRSWPPATVGLAVGVLVTISVLVWVGRRKKYLTVGWCWFLGTLVPVIGLIQVGTQTMADRYTYFPLLGIFLMLAWGGDELFRWRWPAQRRLLPGLAVGVAVACAVLTSRQVSYWKDSRSLFERALAVTANNWVARNALGAEAIRRGDLLAAYSHLSEAERLCPEDQDVRYNLALTAVKMNRLAEAETRLAAIIARAPNHARALNGMGYLRTLQGRFDEAQGYCRRALQLDPEIEEARINLELIQTGAAKAFPELTALKARLETEPGNVELRLRAAALLVTVLRPQEATSYYQKVLEQNPAEPRALTGLGALAASGGNDDEALKLLERAVAADGKHGEARVQLGAVLERLGRVEEALRQYETAVQVRPELAEAWAGLGLLHATTGRMGDAVGELDRAAGLRPDDAEYRMRAGLAAANFQRVEPATRHLRAALQLRPDWHLPLNALAWLLATHPDAAARNGAEAVKLARRACELTKFENPLLLDVLGAALAEAGDFAEAQAMAKRAVELAQRLNSPQASSEFSARLELYRQTRPYRQPRVPSPMP